MRDKIRNQLKAFRLPGRCAFDKVPEHLHDGMVAYFVDGITPGGFFTAVLCNDLCGAFERGDTHSLNYIRALITYMYQYPPSTCWGSVARMVAWQTVREDSPLTEADWTIL